MIIRPLTNQYQLAMIMDAVVLDGARSAHDVAKSTGLCLPLIWSGMTSLANIGLLRTAMDRPGDVHVSPAGVSAVRRGLAELHQRLLAEAGPMREGA